MELRIKEATSLEDILNWLTIRGETIAFRVSRQSSFQIIAECLVPAALHALRRRGTDLNIRLDFDLPDGQTLPDIFRSLGGYSLAYNVSSVLDRDGNQILESLLNILWRKVAVPARGVVGDGKRLSLVSREPDSPVPGILRTDERTVTPSRQDFQAVLRRLGREIGAGGQFKTFAGDFLNSSNEDQVATFLYEAFRNVQDHVAPDSSGIWGILVEKLIVANEAQIQTQARIPRFMRGFLEAAWKRKIGTKPLFLVVMSVADYGPGIQNTLPRPPQETDGETVLRAFERDVSRKPKSGSPNWGQGLPNINDVANRLEAFLFVYSAGVLFVKDCHAKSIDWQPIIPTPQIGLDVGGTVIGIAWAIRDEHPDQEWLPLFGD